MARAVIMGVAGSGKSSVGIALGQRVAARYIDGDDLHPATNIEKMAAGIPLTDEDRRPWLEQVGEVLRAAEGPLLVGCSALKRAYRDLIRAKAGGPVVFIHLAGSPALIAERMSARQAHFMPTSLIDSQFAALQPLAPDETGFAVDIGLPLDAVVAAAAKQLGGMREWDAGLP